MIKNLQRFFHTDTWWEKFIFIGLIYLFSWGVFYGSWLLMPYDWFLDSSEEFGWFMMIYTFILVPFLSFKIPKFINTNFSTDKIRIYVIHVFLLIFSLALFLYINFLQSIPHWFNF